MQIIGLTGSFGSGCSYIAKEFFYGNHILSEERYRSTSLTKILKKEFAKEEKKDPQTATRKELQDFGDRKRRESKDLGYFARLATKKIKRGNNWVIDSIRNPGEVHYLREKFGDDFFLLGIYAKRDVRVKRVLQKKFKNDLSAFDKADERDTGNDSNKYGQRVGDCCLEADIILTKDENFEERNNSAYCSYRTKLKAYMDKISNRRIGLQAKEKDETLMAMAYANAQKSSCLRRKVGAVIVDDCGNIISSGYNEVPWGNNNGIDWEVECCASRFNNKCYRKRTKDKFLGDLIKTIPKVASKRMKVKKLFENNVRLMDLCKAVHAEENAILRLVKNGVGSPLSECTLYTTTFPCRLCANKIATLGFKRVIYVEPYPEKEAQEILNKANIETRFFEGITYKSYFRIYGEER